MRLFVAIDFEGHHDYFKELQQRLSSLGKFSLPNSFHLTLKFLGEVPEAQGIIEKLQKVRFESFEISLNSLGVFPSQSYARVIWVDVEPQNPVIELQRQVDQALGNPDKRFHPHITLARVKSIVNKQGLQNLLSSSVEPRKTQVTGFRLIKSTLSPAGPSYEEIANFASY